MRVHRPNGFYALKLLKRLREELKIKLPEGTFVEKLRPGRHQRAAGAWLWTLNNTHVDRAARVSNIGSIFTVRELARAKEIEGLDMGTYHDLEIFPKTIKEAK